VLSPDRAIVVREQGRTPQLLRSRNDIRVAAGSGQATELVSVQRLTIALSE
jgi:hypothetical protein